MLRETGTYRTNTTHGETVKAFVPHPLPPVGNAINLTHEVGDLP